MLCEEVLDPRRQPLEGGLLHGRVPLDEDLVVLRTHPVAAEVQRGSIDGGGGGRRQCALQVNWWQQRAPMDTWEPNSTGPGVHRVFAISAAARQLARSHGSAGSSGGPAPGSSSTSSRIVRLSLSPRPLTCARATVGDGVRCFGRGGKDSAGRDGARHHTAGAGRWQEAAGGGQW